MRNTSINRKISMYRMLFVVLIFIIIISACQPTPEEPIVISKDNTEKLVIESSKEKEKEETGIKEGKTEEETKQSFNYETPKHITERYNVIEGIMDIAIDADIIMPDIKSVPVAKLRPALFSQQKADELREYFMQDGRLVTRYIRTKEDYDADIIEAKRGVDGKYVFDEDSQSFIEQLIEERKKAPDKDVKNLITDYSIHGEDELEGRIILKGKNIGALFISENHFIYRSDKPWRTLDHKVIGMNNEEIILPLYDIKMTQQEAEDLAYKLLEDLNIESMEIKEVCEVYYRKEFDIRSETEYGGYYFIFMREFGGMMPIHIQGFGIGPNEKFDVSPPVDMEVIRIAVDEYGSITQFSWSDPVEYMGVLTEHVDILPFDDILSRFREFTYIQWSYFSDRAREVLRLKKIYNIELNLNYLPIKNNPNEFMYAPCWVFTYKDLAEHTQEQLDYFKEKGITKPSEDEMGDDYIIFSAVDGASVSAYSTKAFEDMQRRRAESD